jgi:hypothetical protein
LSREIVIFIVIRDADEWGYTLIAEKLIRNFDRLDRIRTRGTSAKAVFD